MSPTILLTADLASVLPDVVGETLVVYHGNAPPWPWTTMPFATFREAPRAHLKGVDTLVFVGLSRAITPGNRTEMVWEVLYNKAGDMRRISVDEVLFRSEPWRAWFHFGFVGAKYREYTYSYIAESQAKSYLDGARLDDPFALDEMLRWSAGVVASSYPAWFDPPIIDILAQPLAVHADYAAEKLAAFEEETSIAAILKRLSLFADGVLPTRSVPPPHRLWSSRSPRFVATDLPIDRWLVGRLVNLIDTTNGIAAGCHRG